MWRLAEDTISAEDLEALADWLRTNPRLTQGPLVKEFEAAWSAWHGSTESLMVSSGTAANFLLSMAALRRIDSGRKPRMGAAAVTWSTNVTPALLLGADVVLFDIDRRTLGINSEQVCEAMSRNEIDVLFITHLLGFNALTKDMLDTAVANNVILLEDCCESHGARFGDAKIGNFGLGSTFSFYFGHHMSTIEGGVISVDDPDLADELRLLRAHGLARESTRFASYAAASPDVDSKFLFVETGLNFRSTEINAFLGLRQLQKLDGFIEIRNRNLEALLDNAPNFLWRDFDTSGVSSYALPLIAVDRARAIHVREVVDQLGIESRPVVAGNLAKQPFMNRPEVSSYSSLDVADHVDKHGIYVGNGHHVSHASIEEMCRRLVMNSSL
ncbi:MAG: DegT/DnrJ/EryC1/StrS family aminotransferase [Acidimicrobiia bacterium]